MYATTNRQGNKGTIYKAINDTILQYLSTKLSYYSTIYIKNDETIKMPFNYSTFDNQINSGKSFTPIQVTKDNTSAVYFPWCHCETCSKARQFHIDLLKDQVSTYSKYGPNGLDYLRITGENAKLRDEKQQLVNKTDCLNWDIAGLKDQLASKQKQLDTQSKSWRAMRDAINQVLPVLEAVVKSCKDEKNVAGAFIWESMQKILKGALE